MKRIRNNRLLLSPLLFILSHFVIYGQDIKISGTIKDFDSEPVIGANIVDKEKKTGTISNESGVYEILVSPGTTLIFSFLGMESQEITVHQSQVLNIVLREDITQLDELIVAVKRPMVESHKGKITYNINKDGSSSNLSAFELLKKLPGVSIGQNDAILLKDSEGANVMINGKMSYLTGAQLSVYLRGINAGDITKIELINNPSAAIDASGNAGIINIVTKNEKEKGYSFSFRSGVSKNEEWWMTNQNLSASFKQEKWDAYASFDFNTPNVGRDGNAGNTIVENGEAIDLQKKYRVPYKTNYYTYKLGTNWRFSPLHRIGFHYSGYFDDFSVTKTSDVLKYRKSDNSLLSTEHTTYDLYEPYYFDSFNLDYQYDIDSLGKKITADAFYIYYRNLSDALMISNYSVASGTPKDESRLKTHQPGFIHIKTAQLDADLPFKNFSLRAGIKYALINHDNKYQSDRLVNGVYEPIPDLTNHFQYREENIAGYLSFARTFSKNSFEVGLRLEQTSTDVQLLTTNLHKKNRYMQFFPSLSFTRQFNDDNQLNFNISRRINRSPYSDLNPIRWYNDEYFYFYGNPNLVPEMAWLVAASYSLKNKYIFNLEYSYRNNYISKYLSYDEDGKTIRSQKVNFKDYNRLDFTAIAPFNITKQWDLQLVGGLNYTAYPLPEGNATKELKRWGGLFKLQQQIKLFNSYALDIDANYKSVGLGGIYLSEDLFFVDVGIRKSFFDDKLNVTLSANDIFYTYRLKERSQSNIINYYYNERTFSQLFGLVLTYHFGGKLIKDSKKKTEELDRL